MITAHTDTQTDAGNDNTRRPKLASGKNGVGHEMRSRTRNCLYHTSTHGLTKILLLDHDNKVCTISEDTCLVLSSIWVLLKIP